MRDTAHPNRRRLIIGGLALAVILLGTAGVLGSHRWTHPSLLVGVGDSVSLSPVPLSKFPLYAGIHGSARGEGSELITISRVRVRFSENEARAKGTVVVCTQRPVKAGSVALGESYTDNPLSRYCTHVRPVKAGTTMRIDRQDSQYFIVVITPTQSGKALVSSVDVTYRRSGSHLFQHGTQHFAQDIRFEVR